MTHDNNWMPLYIGDYLRDTSRLTVEQHGIYLLLIMDYWVNGPLPDNDKQLLAIVRSFGRLSERSSKRTLTALRQILCNYFTKVDSQWHQKRIDFERARSRAAYEQKCRAGLASAASRRANNGTAQPNKRSNGRSSSVRDSVRTQPQGKEEGLAPYVANPVSLTTRDGSPPLPSRGDGGAPLRSKRGRPPMPEPSSDSFITPEEKAAALVELHREIRAKAAIMTGIVEA